MPAQILSVKKQQETRTRPITQVLQPTTQVPATTAEALQLTAEAPQLTAEAPQLTAEAPQLTAEAPQLTAEAISCLYGVGCSYESPIHVHTDCFSWRGGNTANDASTSADS